MKKLYIVPEIARNSRARIEERYHYAVNFEEVWNTSNNDKHRFIFVDEHGFNLWTARTFGRARRGAAANIAVPKGKHLHLTVQGAISIDGPILMETYTSSVNNDMYQAFLHRCMEAYHNNINIPLPARMAGPIFVADNAPCHVRSIQNMGNHWKLPAYTPMLNPIEQVFFTHKNAIRAWFRANRGMHCMTDFNQWGTMGQVRTGLLEQVANTTWNDLDAVSIKHNIVNMASEVINKCIQREPLDPGL